MRKSLNDSASPMTTVAGTGSPGSASLMLHHPNGIFVTVTLDLYVTDCANHRIQRFCAGEQNGTTVAGNGASGNVLLNYPSGAVLDVDGYLFIAGHSHNRIVGSGPDGFRCLVGCSKVPGSSSSQLNRPQAMSFDTDGNMFMIDGGNNRIQRFLLSDNSCGE